MENVYKGNINGLMVLKPKVFKDHRGYFLESFRESIFSEIGIKNKFVQDNESLSNKGVLRGLHFQEDEYAQAKLVRVVKGAVWDVAVDLRPNSQTYGEYYGIELNETNKLQFYVPRGFAHGFVVLQDNTIFQYKCDNYYSKESESGILWNDESLNIPWPIEGMYIVVSEKDQKLPKFKKVIQ